MPATISNPRIGTVIATTVAAACLLQVASAWAGPVTTGPVGSPLASAVLLDPGAAFDPQTPTSQVVAARRTGTGGSASIQLYGRAGAGAWSTAALAFDPATVTAQGAPAATWTTQGLVVVRAQPAGGGCTTSAGIYQAIVTDPPVAPGDPPLAATAALVLQDGATTSIEAPAATTTDGAPVLAALRRSYASGAACASGTAPTSTIPLLAVGVPLATQDLASADPDVARSAPAIAADPSAPSGLAVAVAWTEVAADGLRVIVRRCTRAAPETGSWSCSGDADLRALGPFVALGDGPATPAVAVAEDGSIHVAFAVQGAVGREARYARAARTAPGSWSWSAARRVDQAAPGQAGEQLVPALAVAPNGRADVGFLDTTGVASGRARAYQLSFAPDGTAGDPIALGPDAALPLVASTPSAGSRLAALPLPSAATGDLALVWPTALALQGTSADDAQLVLGRLEHGTTPSSPTLSALQTGKGRPLTIADLLRGTDADGDPVEVEQAGATAGRTEHGTIDALAAGSGRYTPDPAYAGDDAIALRARSLPDAPGAGWGGIVARPITVANALPSFGSTPASVVVGEGETIDVTIPATDPDPTDELAISTSDSALFHFESTPVDGGVRLRIRSTGQRTTSPVAVRMRLSDTTGSVEETRTIQATVAPRFIEPELVVTRTVIALRVVLDVRVIDTDPWAARATGDTWRVDWGDGLIDTPARAPSADHMTFRHSYADGGARRHPVAVSLVRRRTPSVVGRAAAAFDVQVWPTVASLVRLTATASRATGDVRVKLVPRTGLGASYLVRVLPQLGPRTQPALASSTITIAAARSGLTRAMRARSHVLQPPKLRRRQFVRVVVTVAGQAAGSDPLVRLLRVR